MTGRSRKRSRVLAAVPALVLGLAIVLLVGPVQTASATHVECGDTITEDTALDSDIIDCFARAALEIGAPGVTLDLNGHKIAGDLTPTSCLCPDVGVLNRGHADVTIENGTIEVADVGIRLVDADRNTLRGLQVVRPQMGFPSDDAVMLDRADETLIEANGLYGWGGALSLVQSHRNVIRHNTTGLFLCATANACAHNATGGSVGLFLSDDNLLERNSFSQGIVSAFNGAGNVLRRNSITLSIDTGLLVSGQDEIVERNTISDNLGDGILAYTGVRIYKNDVAANRRNGIWLLEGETAAVHNTVSRNGRDGIHAEGSGSLIAKNRALDNFDLGIEAVPDVIDGGGNKASGNGNPLQCLNVECK